MLWVNFELSLFDCSGPSIFARFGVSRRKVVFRHPKKSSVRFSVDHETYFKPSEKVNLAGTTFHQRHFRGAKRCAFGTSTEVNDFGCLESDWLFKAENFVTVKQSCAFRSLKLSSSLLLRYRDLILLVIIIRYADLFKLNGRRVLAKIPRLSDKIDRLILV